MRIQQSIEAIGHFWLEEAAHEGRIPDDPTNIAPGILRINTSGSIELEITGKLVDTIYEDITSTENAPLDSKEYRMYGNVSQFGEVTILGCKLSNVQPSFPAPSKGYFDADLAVTQHRFKTSEEILFTTIFFYIEGLNQWFYNRDPIIDRPNDGENVYNVKFLNPIDQIIPVADQTLLHIGTTLRLSSDYSNSNSVRFAQLLGCSFTTQIPRPITFFWNMLESFKALLTLATGSTVSISDVKAYSRTATRMIADGSETLILLDLYFNDGPVPKDEPIIHSRNMNFTSRDIHVSLNDLISAWFNKYEQIKQPISFFQSTVDDISQEAIVNFSSLVQAMEILHNIEHSNREMTKADFRILRKTILTRFEDDFETKQWLDNKLNIANNVSMNTRITRAFNNLCQLVDDFGPSTTVIKDVVAARNLLAHGSRNQDSYITDDLEKLREIVDGLKSLVLLWVLKMVGFEQDQLRTLVENHDRLRNSIRCLMEKHDDAAIPSHEA